MTEKRLIQISKLLSALFMPFYAPLWALTGQFTLTHLSLMPLRYKMFVFTIFVTFTIILPQAGIYIFRKSNKLTHAQTSHRHNRHTPYMLTIISYAFCLLTMTNMHIPSFIRSIVMTALIATILCGIINLKWKISTHSVAMGGLTSLFFTYGTLYMFDTLVPACICLLLSGMVGTSRIILRQHTLLQVFGGFVLGYVCALACITLL